MIQARVGLRRQLICGSMEGVFKSSMSSCSTASRRESLAREIEGALQPRSWHTTRWHRAHSNLLLDDKRIRSR
uniref:Uncharacterized protein n=1 Tax=Triticum urartu TaxID=4572 RepID=A0A8R7QXN5_TRIUA